MEKYTTIDEYIACFPEPTCVILQQLRTVIKSAVPEATEAISYGIPTFKLNGNLVHFAAYTNHIGFYPGADGIAAFRKEMSDFKLSKGTVQFPIDKPLPIDLIHTIVKYREEQNILKARQKGKIKK